MSGFYAVVLLGGICFFAWLITRLLVVGFRRRRHATYIPSTRIQHARTLRDCARGYADV